MLNKITYEEYEMLESWRDWYGFNSDGGTTKYKVPVRTVLKEWEKSNQNLYKLLGNNLIISKEVEYIKSGEELHRDMSDMMLNGTKDTRQQRSMSDFIVAYNNWFDTAFPMHFAEWWSDEGLSAEQEEENKINGKIRNGLYTLTTINTLSENVYTGEDFTFTLPNGKPYVVRNGCKPLRALAKIAAAFDLPGFEDFRICHSLVHNGKKMKGTLTLSIHPLDYWTMSDNECGWESCMNWRDYGGYRQGTVEMMNSPYVVVAYIAEKDNMSIDNNHEWNSKKWRQLFIVDKSLMLSIKAYPYRSDVLSMEVMKWLKELAETNMDWHYDAEEPVKWHGQAVCDGQLKLAFCSNHMYTDVSESVHASHYLYVGKDIDMTDFRVLHPSQKYLAFNYSGASQCVICGEIDPSFGDSSYVACNKCEDVKVCSYCGDTIPYGEGTYFNNEYICDYCYNEHISRCESCDNDCYSEDMYPIVILPRMSAETAEWAIENHYELKRREDASDYIPAFCDMTLWVCYDCYAHNHFEQDNLLEGHKLFKFDDHHGHHYKACYLDDLNEDGIQSLLNHRMQEVLRNGIGDEKAFITRFFNYDFRYIKILPDA